MAVVIVEHELMRSCQILFGSDKNITRSFLEYIQLSGIKSAYRKKAFETHPDVVASKQGQTDDQNGDLFQIVQQAYENLRCYLQAREQGFRFKSPARPIHTVHPQRPAPRNASHQSAASHKTAKKQWSGAQKNSSAHAETSAKCGGFKQTHSNRYTNSSSQTVGASIPSRQLLFGHYLYYSGIANWHTIVKAIVWQRTERPRVGEIAHKYGWLTNKDILTILKGRKLSDSFGKSAVAMGLLTEGQLRIILLQQKTLQKKFGQYFIHNKLLTPFELQRLVHRFYTHNTTFSAEQARSYHHRM
nr:DnaJ domain-containing protein [Desulfobulbaceae bacterium]